MAICERIARDIRHQYTIGYTPSNPARDGSYRAIRVLARAKGQGKLSVRTRTGYIAGGAPRLARRAPSEGYRSEGAAQADFEVVPAGALCLRHFASRLLRIRSGGCLALPEAREPGISTGCCATGARRARSLRNRCPLPSPKAAPAASRAALIGRIEIPRLALSVVVVEGVDKTSLRRAVGHIPGTALPGEDGNVGLAGHRDTFFLPLKDVKVNDEIQISTLKGNFKYQVVSLKIVDPENVGVLAPSGENVLTLVTCYPFYFVGAGAQAMDRTGEDRCHRKRCHHQM